MPVPPSEMAVAASAALAQRAAEVRAEGGFAADFHGMVASPCIGVCRLTLDRSHCEGCFRTLDELRAWGQADAGQRREIWARLLARAGMEAPAVD